MADSILKPFSKGLLHRAHTQWELCESHAGLAKKLKTWEYYPKLSA